MRLGSDRDPAFDDCAACGRKIRGGAAVMIGGRGPSYTPFLEDLRTTPVPFYHPACWAGEHGVEALLQLVHERDEWWRSASHDCRARIQALKSELERLRRTDADG